MGEAIHYDIRHGKMCMRTDANSGIVEFCAAVTKIPEGVVVGFQIFAWAPK